MQIQPGLTDSITDPEMVQPPIQGKFSWKWLFLLMTILLIVVGGLIGVLFLMSEKPIQVPAIPEVATPTPGNSQVNAIETDFGFELLRKLYIPTEKGNVFISPLSISQALAMVYQGARGETQAEIGLVLGEAKSTLEIPTVSEGELEVVNSLWVNEALAPVEDMINPQYVTDLKTNFKASVGFVNSSQPGSGNKVNQWVATATKNKITELVPSETDSATIMYLINAIYFKGLWDTEYEFDPQLTRNRSFKGESGNIMVSMMEQKNDFLYLENQLFQAVELPYGHKGEVSAMFYLPKPGKMVAFLEELGYDKFKEWAEQTSYHQGTLRLPKFKLDNSYELGQTLQLMGMKSAFTSKANFYGGMMLSDSSLPVQLSKVLHKTFVEVNEKGTEAAAATAVLPIAGGGPDPDEKPFVMEIDRPFVMLIKIRGVAEPLFIGVIRSVNN